MTPTFPYTPFPFNVTAASPLFQLYPVSLHNTRDGWVPSCTTPACIPTASWSTSTINSTVSFQYWGWDVAFDGYVKGNMSIQLLRDGVQAPWSPSEGTLFSLRGEPTDYLYQHDIMLKVLDASTDAQLVVTRARVNASTYADIYIPADFWTIPSNDDMLVYTGFTPQVNVAHSGSPTTYISSKAGDMLSLQLNVKLQPS
ncbi:unnamed protein product [Rhizoctonia solani]|uniref:Uncharacterized protein n=1 Tax=Rhizoctonia solani TaxID=456999 RepID=A0A8H3B9S8_9AGAM|nr:unnamed protein product [Rhizoctonia solani]